MAKVIAGANAVSKQKALDDLWEFNNWLIRPVIYSETLQEFITGDGYDNLEDYLRDNYNYEGEILEKAMRNSGVSIAFIAKKVGYSRRHFYNLFANKKIFGG